MPIYEYQCSECGHQLETIQRLSDPPLTDCPECGTAGLRKLISAAGFRLKGGGWYQTDFKSGSRKNVADSDTKPKPEKSEKSDKSDKSESKAACGAGACPACAD